MALTKAQKNMLRREMDTIKAKETQLKNSAIMFSIIFGIIGLIIGSMTNMIIGILIILAVLFMIWIIVYPILSTSYQVAKRNREFKVKGNA